MGMTIDEIIRSLIAMKLVVGVNQFTINEAIDTMRKYQKIMELFNMYQVTHMKKIDLTSGFENALCELIEGWE